MVWSSFSAASSKSCRPSSRVLRWRGFAAFRAGTFATFLMPQLNCNLHCFNSRHQSMKIMPAFPIARTGSTVGELHDLCE
jgi:hypothetical protein